MMIDRIDLKEEEMRRARAAIAESLEGRFGGAANPSEMLDELLRSEALTVTAPREALTVTAPREALPEMHFVMLNSPTSGKSFKPGNVVVNYKKLLRGLPDLLGAGMKLSAGDTLSKILAVLNVVRLLGGWFAAELSEDEAVVLRALWNGGGTREGIPVEDGYVLACRLCEKLELELGEAAYQKTLDRLVALRAIELENDTVFLKERLVITYK